MKLRITPVSFTGGQRVRVKVVDAMKDYSKGFEIGSTKPKEEVDIFLRKAVSDPSKQGFVQGILDGLDSLKGLAKDQSKVKIKNARGKL